MKKIVLSFALCLMTLGVYADGSVSMGTAQVKQGKTSLVEVNYEITSGSYSAVELYFSMPEGVEIVTTDEDPAAVVKATGENSGMQFILKKSSLFTGAYASNSYVLLGYSGNLTSSGTLCSITLRADASTAIADYNAILNDNSEACVAGHACFDTPTKFDLTATVPFTVSVVADILDLYDDATDLPATSTSTENVVLHRNFTAGVWNSFCVPFDMSAAQIEEAFGSGAQVAEFTSWTADDKDEAAEITLSFTSTATITANTPYIVMPTADATYATGVSISGVNGIEADEVANEIKVKFGTKNRTFGFYGVYVPTVMKTVGDFPLYLKDNKFYYATDNTKIKGYRAFFNNDDTIISSLFEVKYCIDEDPTAIELVDEDVENGMAYTIDGKFVGKNVNLKRMQKGVYIVNGKKVINK